MPGHSRTLILYLAAIGGIVGGTATPATAQTATSAATVMHACYVPLTGTVYRIKEPGLRTACASTSHVEFSWTDGDGALRPTGAVAGDLLQFDGAQWKPVHAQSLGGSGVTGYEVATITVNHAYNQPVLQILSSSLTPCGFFFCTEYAYLYRANAPAATSTISCPTGKKVFGAFAGASVTTDILVDGSVSVGMPAAHRDGPTQIKVLDQGQSPNSSTLPNQLAGQPGTAPDNIPVKLVCANAS